MTAGHWLTSCRAEIATGHPLETRLNSIDWNNKKLIVRRAEVQELTARVRNVFIVLDAAPRDQLADEDDVLKELLIDFVSEISQLCEFIKSFVALHFLFRLARNQKLTERIEQAHGELDRFLEGILQSGLIAGNQELVARLQELVHQQPWVVVVADDELARVNEKLQQPVSPEIVSETRCVLDFEVPRLARLGISNSFVEAVNGHLGQPNPTEVDEQRRPMPRVIPLDEITFDDERDKPIGEGGCGVVWRAHLGSSIRVVVKRMINKPLRTKCGNDATTCTCTEHTTARDILQLRREAHVRELQIWCQLNHPHILRLHGTTSHGPRCSIVSEDARYGNLKDFMRDETYLHLWRLLYEAALGIHYMHSVGIVHGDLKVDNILIGGDMKAKIADFGLSFRNGEHESVPQSAAWGVLAPEFFAADRARSFPADVFAFGMCIVEAYTGGSAWIGAHSPAVIKLRFRREELPYVFSTLNADVRNLVERMCRFDPAERIRMNDVVVELQRLADNPPPSHPKRDTECA